MSNPRLTSVFDHPAFRPHATPSAPHIVAKDGLPLPTLGDLLNKPSVELARYELGFKNLLCATILPDTFELDIPGCLKTLHELTQHVKRETDRCMHQFARDPQLYRNSEEYFRALMLTTVVQLDFGVTYDPGCRDSQEFKGSHEGFIHGLLTGKKMGTCANIPVLKEAVMGYNSTLGQFIQRDPEGCRWAKSDPVRRWQSG